jgi:signal transduction histidine kinase
LAARRGTPEGCRECLGALAHRLAQSATALRGGIELALLGNHAVSEYQSVLEQSLQLADHMVELIVSLRDLAESGAPAGPAQSVILEPLLREAVAEMQGLAESRGLRVRFRADGPAGVCVNPNRLRDSLQNLLAWVIHNSTEGGIIDIGVSASDGETQVSLALPRLDLQYLQVKVLEDISSPGLLFSHAANSGAMGWAINRRLVEGLGGKLEMVTEGMGAGCIRARFPIAPPT